MTILLTITNTIINYKQTKEKLETQKYNCQQTGGTLHNNQNHLKIICKNYNGEYYTINQAGTITNKQKNNQVIIPGEITITTNGSLKYKTT